MSEGKLIAESVCPRRVAKGCAMTATPPALRIVRIASSGVGAK